MTNETNKIIMNFNNYDEERQKKLISENPYYLDLLNEHNQTRELIHLALAQDLDTAHMIKNDKIRVVYMKYGKILMSMD